MRWRRLCYMMARNFYHYYQGSCVSCVPKRCCRMQRLKEQGEMRRRHVLRGVVTRRAQVVLTWEERQSCTVVLVLHKGGEGLYHLLMSASHRRFSKGSEQHPIPGCRKAGNSARRRTEGARELRVSSDKDCANNLEIVMENVEGMPCSVYAVQ